MPNGTPFNIHTRFLSGCDFYCTLYTAGTGRRLGTKLLGRLLGCLPAVSLFPVIRDSPLLAARSMDRREDNILPDLIFYVIVR